MAWESIKLGQNFTLDLTQNLARVETWLIHDLNLSEALKVIWDLTLDLNLEPDPDMSQHTSQLTRALALQRPNSQLTGT